VKKPVPPFADYDARRLLENCWIKEGTPQWRWTQPPQKPARAVRVHVLFTGPMFALATAYRLPCEQAAGGAEPIGWQRWRRQLLEQTRNRVLSFAEADYGILHSAESSLLLGVKLKDVPPGIGTRQEILKMGSALMAKLIAKLISESQICVLRLPRLQCPNHSADVACR
jgi:hypothetical protein